MTNSKQKTITKENVATQLHNKLGLSMSICEEFVHELIDEIYLLTKQDQSLTIQNFGKFYINHKKPRPGFNMHSNELIQITPRTVMRFIPSNALKNEVNKKYDDTK